MIIDIDNHDGELISVDIRALLNAGVTKAVVGLQYPNPSRYPAGVAHQQIEALLDAGIAVECYAESQHIYDTWPKVEQFKSHISRVWVACEEDHVDRVWIDQHLDFIDALNLGHRGGIYTAAWWWNEAKEFYHWFGDRELWVAQYDNRMDIDAFQQFGDWTQATMKQWNGDTYIGRLHVDLNVERDYAPIAQPPSPHRLIDAINRTQAEFNRLREIAGGK